MNQFDEIIPRKGTHCVKHDALLPNFGADDLLPMWVADMDFRTPSFILDAIRTRCQHEVLGYAVPSDGYFSSVISWLSSHYSIEAQRAELHFIPGIVAGISFVLQAFTQPGDKVLVTTPVYPPFLNLPGRSQRQMVCSPLRIVDGRFAVDFDDFRCKAQGCKVFILSNPHNPGGTVWSRADLLQMAEICAESGTLVIADEIHADLVLPGYRHTSFSTVGPCARENSITFMAPSKTFNMAGLGSSIAYTPSARLREQFHNYLDTFELANGNIFAFVAAEAAFRNGEPWLLELRQYLLENVAFLNSYLRHSLPQVSAVLPEASFLPWLDFSAFGLSHQQCKERLIGVAKVALNDGTTFGGSAYERCFRLNIGCPRATLQEALDRIRKAF